MLVTKYYKKRAASYHLINQGCMGVLASTLTQLGWFERRLSRDLGLLALLGNNEQPPHTPCTAHCLPEWSEAEGSPPPSRKEDSLPLLGYQWRMRGNTWMSTSIQQNEVVSPFSLWRGTRKTEDLNKTWSLITPKYPGFNKKKNHFKEPGNS